jgi:transcription elongation factor Elf1
MSEETYGQNIICPWCGHIHKDSWEIQPHAEDGTFDCHECEKPILFSRSTTVRYSANKAPVTAK